MYQNEINEAVRDIKKKSLKCLSNFVYTKIKPGTDYEVISNEDAIMILDQEEYRVSGYYVSKDDEALVRLLKDVPKDIYIERFHMEKEDELSPLFLQAGCKTYAKYIRITTTYKENPYHFGEKGRRKILEQMYDETMPAFAEEKDAEEIFELCKQEFDPISDDIFSVEEWRKIIASKECMIVKENGKIVSLYRWRLDGKKLYSNVSINLGPANLLYNLERFVFDKYWNEGIRTYYAWINMENAKALKRGPQYIKEIVSRKTELYSSIYVK